MDVRLDEVVLRSLEKQPERRYQRASEVKTDLESISGPPFQGTPAIAPASSSKPEMEAVRQQVKWPARGLLVTGILNWVILPFVLAFLSYRSVGLVHAHPPMAGFGFSKVATIGLVLLPFVLCSFIIFGGLKMMRLEAYGVAIGASILAMIVTPGNLIGFPVGIWALVTLARLT